MAICQLCDDPVCARGLCRNHYMQAWKRGEHILSKTKDLGSLQDRLMAKVSKLSSGCWGWTGQCNYYGYGLIWHNGRVVRAHRISYTLFRGPIKRGNVVCHHCDNPGCINPEHLFSGTRLDNNLDCSSKGRRPRGDTHWNSKLSEVDVLNIRKSKATQLILSAKFGVSQSQICRIKTGKRRE